MDAAPNRDPPDMGHVSAATHAENVAFHGSPQELMEIACAGPRGALAVAGLAVFVLLALWIAFFFFVFAPRGSLG
ncbi:hypothetical protein [Variovorax saccharolyticus]|uniref:hypothetical protein n=1 Tax=Variovorax saccharolyticus TaxID=3053516 RepID=UPI002577B44B|nr:hypothetical protein [Variovorax sp. J22R187]MDM0021400.1 hypothetical protein [Variovorax sp. J22R187]